MVVAEHGECVPEHLRPTRLQRDAEALHATLISLADGAAIAQAAAR